MPTVKRVGPYRLFFYSNEGDEPRHVHVRSGDGEAKFWLEPIELVWQRGFNQRKLGDITDIIREDLDTLIEAWDRFFSEI